MKALDRQPILDLLCELIRTPSVNPSLAAEGTGEGAIAELACRWLSENGVPAWTEEAGPGRPNVVAEVKGADPGPTLVLCAHLDTVGTQGMSIPPFEPRVDANRVYGRGSYDMKGSVAAVMAVAASLARKPPPGTLLLALVADEEYESLGARHFVEHHPADACIVTEPSEGQLILTHKGFLWAELETTGQAAHGSRWDRGRSAIGRMGRIIAALEDLDTTVLRRRAYPLLEAPSLHCALIEGGVGLSTYAPHCRLKVERRTLPGETRDQVLDELRQAVHRAGEEAEIRCLLERPPLHAEAHHDVVRALQESATQVLGEPPREAGVNYWMDAALFAEAGIPTVNYGPGGEGAHAATEWVDLESVASCAQVLRETARRFARR